MYLAYIFEPHQEYIPPDFNIEEFMEWFADDFNNKEAIIEQGTEKLIRGSLKASGNEEFIRIEQLNLRRCRE